MKRQLGKDDFVILEGIRGLAALYVVLNHARGHAWAGHRWLQESGLWATLSPLDKALSGLNQLTRLGHEAVIIFFVLSGFSIAHSLRAAPATGRFYLRRFLRLYPPKVVALAWAIAVFVITSVWTPYLYDVARPSWNLSGSRDFLTAGVVLRNLAYMPRGGFIVQFWSLPHEMLFYLLAPLLVPRPRLFLAIALLGYGVGFVGPVGGMVDSSFLLSFACRYLLYFAIGTFFYAVFDAVERRFEKVDRLPVVFALAALFIGLVPLTLRTGSTRLTEILAVAMAVILVPAFLKWRLRGRLIDWLGRQSYSLYLTHVATIILVTAMTMRIRGTYAPFVTPYVWIGLVPFCLVIAELNFKIVEGPSRRWVAAFRGERVREVAPASGSGPEAG